MIEINPLVKNESRYDRKKAAVNLITILAFLGIEFFIQKRLRLGVAVTVVKKRDNKEHIFNKTKVVKNLILLGNCENNLEYLIETEELKTHFKNLYIKKWGNKFLFEEFLKDIYHAAYCGCDGCFSRTKEAKVRYSL